MKRWYCAGAAALAGALLALTGGAREPLWPLERIGAGLRALSLSGSGGDLLAWLLWAALSLLPLLLLLPRGRRRGLADALVVLASIASFPMWYCLANPDVLPVEPWAQPMARALLALLPAILLCGAVMLRCTEPDGAKAFLRRTGVLLALLMALEAFAAAFAIVGSLRGADANALVPALVQAACALAVCAATLRALSAAIGCVGAMEAGWFSAEKEALLLARRARAQLTVVVLAAVLSALTGFVALARGAGFSVEWALPFGELLAALACALLARFVAEGARLQRESEEFI